VSILRRSDEKGFDVLSWVVPFALLSLVKTDPENGRKDQI
jgi:hypothetical protein